MGSRFLRDTRGSSTEGCRKKTERLSCRENAGASPLPAAACGDQFQGVEDVVGPVDLFAAVARVDGDVDELAVAVPLAAAEVVPMPFSVGEHKASRGQRNLERECNRVTALAEADRGARHTHRSHRTHGRGRHQTHFTGGV